MIGFKFDSTTYNIGKISLKRTKMGNWDNLFVVYLGPEFSSLEFATKLILKPHEMLFTLVNLAGSSCPSPTVTYAAKADNVTLCWQIPADINLSTLTRFTVLALKRPVQLVMEKVASAKADGKFFRTYDDYHAGLYNGRATMDADLNGRMVFFKITNYSTTMENVYCLLYEMFVFNDVPLCHSHAIFLRTVGKCG